MRQFVGHDRFDFAGDLALRSASEGIEMDPHPVLDITNTKRASDREPHWCTRNHGDETLFVPDHALTRYLQGPERCSDEFSFGPKLDGNRHGNRKGLLVAGKDSGEGLTKPAMAMEMVRREGRGPADSKP